MGNRKDFRMNSRKKLLCFALIVLLRQSLISELTVPSIISDNMVLQRETCVPIWGWANAHQEVIIESSWLDKPYKTKADASGRWIIKIETPRAEGSYEMTISTESGKIELKNILMGEVWLCSGQSNMVLPVSQVNNAEREITEANYPQIHFFTVDRAVAEEPVDDVNGKWVLCNPETVKDFSAVGYFFGREVHNKIGVPVGLINSG